MVETILQTMLNLVVAVLLLTPGLLNCDSSQTIKGLHQHAYVVVIENKARDPFPASFSASLGLENIQWPNTGYGNTKFPTTGSGNVNQFITNSDSLKLSNIGNYPLGWSDMISLNQNQQAVQQSQPTQGQGGIKKSKLKAVDKSRINVDLLSKKRIPEINGMETIRSVANSQGNNKLSVGLRAPNVLVKKESQDEDRVEVEYDDDSEEDSVKSKTKGQEDKNKSKDILVRNIQTKKTNGQIMQYICPEDIMYLQHMLGMRPMMYQYIDLRKFANQNADKRSEGIPNQTFFSKFQISDTKRIRSRIYTPKKPLLSKIRSLFRD